MNTKLNKLIIFFGIIVAFSLASNAYAAGGGEGKFSARDHYAIVDLTSDPDLQHEPAKSEDYNLHSNSIPDRRGSKGNFVSSTGSMESDNKGRFTSKRDMNKVPDRYLSNRGAKGMFAGHDSECIGKC